MLSPPYPIEGRVTHEPEPPILIGVDGDAPLGGAPLGDPIGSGPGMKEPEIKKIGSLPQVIADILEINRFKV